MPLEKTDYRRNVIDLLDRALTGGVVVDSGVAAPAARATWPSHAPADAAHHSGVDAPAVVVDTPAAPAPEPAPILLPAAEAAEAAADWPGCGDVDPSPAASLPATSESAAD